MDAAPTTVARVLDRALHDDPERVALVTRTKRITYGELDSLANRAARALHEYGISAGDRVAASLPNEADVAIAFHGAMRLGAVWVGINRVLAPPEKRWMLADCGAALWLTDDSDPPAAVPGEAGAQVVGIEAWRAALDAAADTPLDVDVDPFAPAGIAYTSGTTGRPKGAVHSQYNLLLPGRMLVESRGYGPDLRKGDCFPFTILNMAVLTALLVSQAGGTSIVMDRIDALGVTEWIREEHVTLFNGPPALLLDLATRDDIGPEDLGTLTEVWTGGGDCPEPIREVFHERVGVPIVSTYGLSEAPTVVSIDDPQANDHVPAASGRALPHLSLRIADEQGTSLPAGESGEIRVAPVDDRYRLFDGYWERPEASEDVTAGGELHTGDVGYLDEDGALHVQGRLSLVIVRGGANVYPAEVERVMLDHPAVTAAAVFGVPDERLGERVVAVVQPTEGAKLDTEELRSFLTDNLARYKVPEQIAVVADLPRNAMGKIVRAALPELL